MVRGVFEGEGGGAIIKKKFLGKKTEKLISGKEKIKMWKKSRRKILHGSTLEKNSYP